MTYRIYVRSADWPEPYAKDIPAENIAEAVDKLVRILDKDTTLCPASDGGIWYYVKPEVG